MALHHFRSSVALLLGLALSVPVMAHPRDELGQATYVEITANTVSLELDLTPGEQLAPAFVALIDTNHDGSFSQAEQDRYAQKVAGQLTLTLDGTLLPIQRRRTTVPDFTTLRHGADAVRLYLAAVVPPQSAGSHRLHFENHYAPLRSGYLVATLAGSGGVVVGTQVRDPLQKSMDLAVSFPTPSPSPPAAYKIALVVVLVFGALTLGLRRRR